MNRKVEIRDCELGKGIFAIQNLEANEVIAFVTGKLMSREAIDALGRLGENSYQVDFRTYVYPTTPAMYLNHSCEPNAGLDSDLRLIALRDIAVGEEIRYDYSTSMMERSWTMECKCGSPKCRGVVDDFDRLPKKIRNFYLDREVVQGFILTELENFVDNRDSAA